MEMQSVTFFFLVLFAVALANPITNDQDQLHPYGKNDRVEEQFFPNPTNSVESKSPLEPTKGQSKFLLHQLFGGGGQQNNYQPVPVAVPYPYPYSVHSTPHHIPHTTHHATPVAVIPVAPVHQVAPVQHVTHVQPVPPVVPYYPNYQYPNYHYPNYQYPKYQYNYNPGAYYGK